MNNMLSFPLPVFSRLLEDVLDSAAQRHSMLHGERHWRAVAFTALELAPLVPGADALVGFLFGLLHDSQRMNDGGDPQHGPRAGVFARSLAERGLLPLEQNRLDVLVAAMHEHTTGRSSRDPTIGLCWDADRLNLWRIGVEPRAAFLSTTAAKSPQQIAAHRALPGENMSWISLYDRLSKVNEPS